MSKNCGKRFKLASFVCAAANGGKLPADRIAAPHAPALLKEKPFENW